MAHDNEKALLAAGTQILYEEGLVDAFGHLSFRIPGTDHFLINPRQSPALLTPETVLTMSLDGDVIDGPNRPNSEWHIHASIYRARPDVASVCHAHTPMSILFSMSSAGLRPLVGQTVAPFGPEPLPVYPHPRLIRDRAKGDTLAACLGKRIAVLLRGHGCVVACASIQETVIRMLELERNGRILQASLATGQGEPRYWTRSEAAEWAADSNAGVTERTWEYLTTRPKRLA